MLTKIEAVNIILNVIGETPVSSLASGLPDAEAADSNWTRRSKRFWLKAGSKTQN